MADAAVIHIGENSPEYVAFRLLEKIASSEGRVFHDRPTGTQQLADRAWILATYQECLVAVMGHRVSK